MASRLANRVREMEAASRARDGFVVCRADFDDRGAIRYYVGGSTWERADEEAVSAFTERVRRGIGASTLVGMDELDLRML